MLGHSRHRLGRGRDSKGALRKERAVRLVGSWDTDLWREGRWMLAELMADRGNWAQVMHGARACLFSLKNGPFPLTLRLEPLNRHNIVR